MKPGWYIVDMSDVEIGATYGMPVAGHRFTTTGRIVPGWRHYDAPPSDYDPFPTRELAAACLEFVAPSLRACVASADEAAAILAAFAARAALGE